jgi:hypothetical protein
MAKAFMQGYYVPKNPDKYVGDLSKIRYMSSYEYETHSFFDNNQRVLKWSSEPFSIPYLKPTDGRLHKYYPDYWVQYVTSDGEIKEELIEVKPRSQTSSPRGNSKYRAYEQLTFAVNQAKWAAARQLCDQKGWGFRIITEKSIFK